MRLLSAQPEPVAFACDAYLINGGTHLRCWLLFVRRGNTQRDVTLRCTETNQEIRVRLPEAAEGTKGYLRFWKETLEVIHD